MVEKRNLRSGKPASSPATNGDKATAASHNTSAGPPGKTAPSRTTTSRTKAAPMKKVPSNLVAKEKDDEKLHLNGTPVESGINGTSEDVEMEDVVRSIPENPKLTKDIDGDEEMTVVVPPPKGSKLSDEAPLEQEGDVVMIEVDKAESEKPEEEKPDPVLKAVNDIKGNFALLERAVALFDARFTLRVLRSISSIRKRLTPEILAQVITDIYPSTNATAKALLATIGKSDAFSDRPPLQVQSHQTIEMEIDSDQKASTPSPSKAPTIPKEAIPEFDIYLSILVQTHLLDIKAFELGAKFSSNLVEKIHSLNRRTLDSLSARVYYYYCLFYEQLAPLAPSPLSPIIGIRPQLLSALRTAVLRKDPDTQAAVITLLLRNYLSTSHITQADLLVSHTQFPQAASNSQIARYLYYLGRIRAIQLSYTEAHEHLVGATRKSPSSPSAAGFYQASHKLLVVVELLMGDIPDRSIFRQPSLERALEPYFQLVQVVRVGDLDAFQKTVQANNATFRRDGTHSLILRLRQNVIKTGIRMMSLSYSRISLRDICVRLELGSEESAEYIVAKAIRDGVIEATLDHEKGFMKSKEIGDVYATREPGEAFHDRIRACLGLHDESVKAMRFPMNQHRLELKNAQEARERERELAKEIQEGDMDEDDAGGDFEGI
ncbi:MAG: 26S proteasome non-ATPase regulatory subunit [Trizodia sp. TS-e1964]|nr:MAG: 26S proteasome non-ATPase regulatory subunit [Trizodia sp. TS-e1964]